MTTARSRADPTASRPARRYAARLLAESCLRITANGTLERVRAPAALAALRRLCERLLASAGRPVAIPARLQEATALSGPPPPGARAAALVGMTDPVGAVAYVVAWLADPPSAAVLEELARDPPPRLRLLASTPGFPTTARA